MCTEAEHNVVRGHGARTLASFVKTFADKNVSHDLVGRCCGLSGDDAVSSSSPALYSKGKNGNRMMEGREEEMAEHRE